MELTQSWHRPGPEAIGGPRRTIITRGYIRKLTQQTTSFADVPNTKKKGTVDNGSKPPFVKNPPPSLKGIYKKPNPRVSSDAGAQNGTNPTQRVSPFSPSQEVLDAHIAGGPSPTPQLPSARMNRPDLGAVDEVMIKRARGYFTDVDERAMAYDHLPVHVSVKKPKRWQSFNDAAWTSELMKSNLMKMRFHRPTLVQQYMMPLVMAGHDVLLCAPSGSGKTMGYLIPTLMKLYQTTRVGSNNMAYPTVLVLVPTRDLALELYEVVKALIEKSHLKAVVTTGGTPMVDQVLALRNGCNLLIATPGRLLDLVNQRKAVRLTRVRLMIVDAADVMFEPALESQLRKILASVQLPGGSPPTEAPGPAESKSKPDGFRTVRSFKDRGPIVRQSILVTSLQPQGFKELTEDFLTNPVTLTVGEHSPHLGPSDQVKHEFQLVEPERKVDVILQLLHQEEGLVAVFARDRERANELHQSLVQRGISASLLHGGQPRAQRDETIQCFKYGITQVLVTCGVSSAGLNLPDISVVVNFDLPGTIEEYSRRAGRTGRGGRAGRVVSFVRQKDQPLAGPLVQLMIENGIAVPSWLEDLALPDESKTHVVGIESAGWAYGRELPFGTYLPDEQATLKWGGLPTSLRRSTSMAGKGPKRLPDIVLEDQEGVDAKKRQAGLGLKRSVRVEKRSGATLPELAHSAGDEDRTSRGAEVRLAGRGSKKLSGNMPVRPAGRGPALSDQLLNGVTKDERLDLNKIRVSATQSRNRVPSRGSVNNAVGAIADKEMSGVEDEVELNKSLKQERKRVASRGRLFPT